MMRAIAHIFYSHIPAKVMARKPLTNPRKKASQERSRLTVSALLEATARILVKDGYDQASTNRIAQAAGVSIGSLYQYFPSKEALVAAVIDQHTGEVLHVVRSALERVEGEPVAVVARTLIKAMIDAHQIDSRLHRVLSEQIPRVGRLERIEAIDKEACALVRGYLEGCKQHLRVTDLDQAAFICVSTVEALTHALVMRQPGVSGRDTASFIDEVARLIVGYLGK